MAERMGALAAPHIALQVEIEQVLPRCPANRARFDFAQIDVPQCKYRKSLEQHSRLVFKPEDDAGFVPTSLKQPAPRKCEKSSVIFRFVLYARDAEFSSRKCAPRPRKQWRRRF